MASGISTTQFPCPFASDLRGHGSTFSFNSGLFKKAEDFFTRIKENYSKSDQGRDIEKFINAAKYVE